MPSRKEDEYNCVGNCLMAVLFLALAPITFPVAGIAYWRGRVARRREQRHYNSASEVAKRDESKRKRQAYQEYLKECGFQTAKETLMELRTTGYACVSFDADNEEIIMKREQLRESLQPLLHCDINQFESLTETLKPTVLDFWENFKEMVECRRTRVCSYRQW